MKIKAGDKFIIEVAESLWNAEDVLGRTKLYRIKGFESLALSEEELSRLTKVVITRESEK